MMQLIEAQTETQLKNIEALYLRAFPKAERKPFSMIIKMRDAGISEILLLEEEDGRFAGLVITLAYKDLVLLDYFAIDDAKRGMGIGSAALALLQERYRGKRFFLEIESTVDHEIEERVRRKRFYQAAGMVPMNYLVDLFGVEMEIMTFECKVAFEEYHEIFEELFPKKFADRICFVREI